MKWERHKKSSARLGTREHIIGFSGDQDWPSTSADIENMWPVVVEAVREVYNGRDSEWDCFYVDVSPDSGKINIYPGLKERRRIDRLVVQGNLLTIESEYFELSSKFTETTRFDEGLSDLYARVGSAIVGGARNIGSELHELKSGHSCHIYIFKSDYPEEMEDILV